MQTVLERDAINIRHDVQVRGDVTTHNVLSNRYMESDQYSSMHKDALADGDTRGKGTGHGGHTHSVPNFNLPKTLINYSDIDTSLNSGDDYDQNGRNGVGGRNTLTGINIYGPNNEYSAAIVDTTANVSDGQIVI